MSGRAATTLLCMALVAGAWVAHVQQGLYAGQLSERVVVDDLHVMLKYPDTSPASQRGLPASVEAARITALRARADAVSALPLLPPQRAVIIAGFAAGAMYGSHLSFPPQHRVSAFAAACRHAVLPRRGTWHIWAVWQVLLLPGHRVCLRAMSGLSAMGAFLSATRRGLATHEAWTHPDDKSG